MKKLLAFAVVAMLAGSGMAYTDTSADGAYTVGNPFGGLDGGGVGGFGAWDSSGSTGGGNFVGDPTAAGISGLGTVAFGLWCNGSDGNNSEVARAFESALTIGQTFSFTLGVNWDNDIQGSNKGFSLLNGGTEIFNLNHGPGQTSTITWTAGANSGNWSTGYGTNAFAVSILYKDATTITVSGTTRDGGVFAATDLTVVGAPDSFKFYMNNASGGDQRQLYFDDLSVTGQTIPEPATMGLLGLGALALALRRKIRK
jgi:hypothetical protein